MAAEHRLPWMDYLADMSLKRAGELLDAGAISPEAYEWRRQLEEERKFLREAKRREQDED